MVPELQLNVVFSKIVAESSVTLLFNTTSSQDILTQESPCRLNDPSVVPMSIELKVNVSFTQDKEKIN